MKLYAIIIVILVVAFGVFRIVFVPRKDLNEQEKTKIKKLIAIISATLIFSMLCIIAGKMLN
ncbi:MAG: hypothetical protein K6F27_08450 [Ruminococcus sp.]|nr:hypothetical protein [Ruminococcus sp.]